MPDITMCANTDCQKRFQCYRHPASGTLGSDYQSYAEFLLVTDFGEGTGCPGDLSGGSVILTASAIVPRDHPEGGRHAGG
jgi:hypothetical protein